MSNTNQPRRPAGTPAGGQWAPTAHDEADIRLDKQTTLGAVRQMIGITAEEDYVPDGCGPLGDDTPAYITGDGRVDVLLPDGTLQQYLRGPLVVPELSQPRDETGIDLGGPRQQGQQAPATDAAMEEALRMADSREVADRIRALPGGARSQLAKDARLFPGAVLTMGDVELYEQGQRLTTAETGADLSEPGQVPATDDIDDEDQLWSGWDDGDRPRLLTLKESEQVRAWRAVASRYRHGDCGRQEHKIRGCDIVCVSAHSKFEGDEGANEVLRKPPWEKSYRRPTTEESNAVTDLMCRLVMHAVPKPMPEAAQPGPKDQPCDGKAGHPARDCHACAVESERQMLFSINGH